MKVYFVLYALYVYCYVDSRHMTAAHSHVPLSIRFQLYILTFRFVKKAVYLLPNRILDHNMNLF